MSVLPTNTPQSRFFVNLKEEFPYEIAQLSNFQTFSQILRLLFNFIKISTFLGKRWSQKVTNFWKSLTKLSFLLQTFKKVWSKQVGASPLHIGFAKLVAFSKKAPQKHRGFATLCSATPRNSCQSPPSSALTSTSFAFGSLSLRQSLRRRRFFLVLLFSKKKNACYSFAITCVNVRARSHFHFGKALFFKKL